MPEAISSSSAAATTMTGTRPWRRKPGPAGSAPRGTERDGSRTNEACDTFCREGSSRLPRPFCGSGRSPPDQDPRTRCDGAHARREARLMCGIAGVHEYRGRKAVDPSTALSMLDAIAHRGPDDEGLHLTERIALGARRLSIIDPEGAPQPIANEDGTVVAACNGEIYNFRALRERLLRSGHVLRTNVDIEVLVHLSHELGDGLVDDLDGMFAFSI